jgi:hypothetical protein
MVKSEMFAPIAQWTERWPPEPKTAVRACLGVLENKNPKPVYIGFGVFVLENKITSVRVRGAPERSLKIV